MEIAYLSLGSNLGDRQENLARAMQALEQRGIKILRRSGIYETEPVEIREQGWFLNCVLEVETDLAPRELMDALLEIERGLGRRRGVKYGPREIDLDILLYGAQIVKLLRWRFRIRRWRNGGSCWFRSRRLLLTCGTRC